MLYNTSTNKSNDYGYSIKGSVLRMTDSEAKCSLGEFSYTFNSAVGTCAWVERDSIYNYNFRGKDETYSNQKLLTYNQDYQFTGENLMGTKLANWNLTYDFTSMSLWNRALGSANPNASNVFTQKVQSSNVAVATKLGTSDSYLLGQQSINSVASRDFNTNRPQIQTSWRQFRDNFGDNARSDYLVPDDSKTNNINGARARTGHHFNHIFIFL
jgi:hypothetical protein